MDFTLRKYRQLISSFLAAGYRIVPVQVYLSEPSTGKVLILRHDVDELSSHALKIARVEQELGVKSTFYFRRVPKSDNPRVIKAIAAMGHEIGYHYEDLSVTHGNVPAALSSFSDNLAYFRTYYPVKTVCMHGSSSSQFDNRELWQHVSFSDYGLIGEPYLSFDFNKVYYLSDTGYAWDGGRFAVRDRVQSSFGLSFHTSNQIIETVTNGSFPDQVLMLAHTLWTDNLFKWLSLHLREFLRNRVKLLAQKSGFVSQLYAKLVSLYWK